MQRPHGVDGSLSDVQSALHQRAQFEQTHTQLVQAAIHTIHVATDDQIIENAMRSRRVQTGRAGQVFERNRIRLSR